MAFVLDTHALIWYTTGHKRLSSRVKRVLSETSDELLIPAIALAEASRVLDSRQSGLSGFKQLLKVIDEDPRFRTITLDRSMVEEAVMLENMELHDRLILATAIVLNQRGMQVTLVTRDENISSSGLVPVLW